MRRATSTRPNAPARGRRPPLVSAALSAVVLLSTAAITLLLATASASATTTTFGSPLSVPATKDTAADLGYPVNRIPIPGTASFLAVYHDGADTALWNVQLAGGSPTAPASGQIVSVRLEGCAKSNGPPPLTQIHFQDLVPQGGGAVKVNVTTQAFDIPVCGQEGVGGGTITTYQPTNFCVAQGDYVDFNDEGGFVPSSTGPPPYPSGVPYTVIGSVPGSTMDSFIRNGGVNNGTTFSPTDTTYHDGFTSNPGEELMLQATLATGPDATPLCPGGTKGVPSSAGTGSGPLASRRHTVARRVTLPGHPQLDGMNSHGVVQVAIFCHASSGVCAGTLTLRSQARHGSASVQLGSARFSVAFLHTGKVRVHLSSLGQRLVRNTRGHLGVDVTLNGNAVAGPGALKASIAVRGARKR
jgi:hypothetical protein